MKTVHIRILSFNIWDLPLWFVKDREIRIRNIAKYIKKSDADVICLQESFDVGHRILLRDQLKEKYQIAGDAMETRRILFVKLFDMTGGLVVFSKFPIVRSQFIPYGRFLNSDITEMLGRKGFLEVFVKTPAGEFRIVNTHMHQESIFFDKIIRLRQMTKMIMKMDHSEVPTVLAGDFNEDHLMDDGEFAELFKKTGFSNPLKLKSGEEMPPTYRPENRYVDNWWNRIRFPKRYDYMLVKNLSEAGLRVVDYRPRYITPPLSDHDPLLLILETHEPRATTPHGDRTHLTRH